MPPARDVQRLAARFVAILDRRIGLVLNRRLTKFQIGTVTAVSVSAKTCSVNFGDGTPSQNIKWSDFQPDVGDVVRVVIEPTGTRWVVDNITGASDSGWIAPTFQNSWENYGGSFTPAGYRKDASGFVHLRGLVKNGSSATAVMFTLPSGYRPGYQQLLIQPASGGATRIDISIAGFVMQVTGAGYVNSTTWASLDGIVFKAE